MELTSVDLNIFCGLVLTLNVWAVYRLMLLL